MSLLPNWLRARMMPVVIVSALIILSLALLDHQEHNRQDDRHSGGGVHSQGDCPRMVAAVAVVAVPSWVSTRFRKMIAVTASWIAAAATNAWTWLWTSKVGMVIRGAASRIWTWLSTSTLGRMIGTAASRAWAWLATKFPAATSWIVTTAATVWKWLLNTPPKLASWIATAATNAWTWLLNTPPKLASWIATAATNAWTWLWTSKVGMVVRGAASRIWTWLSTSTLGRMIGTATRAWTSFRKMVAVTASWIATAVTNAWTWLWTSKVGRMIGVGTTRTCAWLSSNTFGKANGRSRWLATSFLKIIAAATSWIATAATKAWMALN